MIRKIAFGVAVYLALACMASAVTLTTIQDTLYSPSGTPLTGSIIVNNPVTFTAADGTVVPAGTVTVFPVVSGAVNIPLVPNAGSTPAGSTYDVEYNLPGYRASEIWSVPQSGTPVNLATVRISIPPTLAPQFAMSQVTPPQPCAAGQYPQWSGAAWICVAGTGAGTVTSVGLSLPSLFSVSGSPVTTSGTLTAALASQTQNLFFASPNGASGAPSFRALLLADLPSIAFSNLTGTVSDTQLANAYSGVGACAAYQFASTFTRNAGPTCNPALTALTAPAHEWLSAVSAAGVFTASQPSFADISGTITPSQISASPVVGDCPSVAAGGTSFGWAPCGGGSGTPGGLSGQLQGNHAGAFGGVPGSAINFTSGEIDLQAQSDVPVLTATGYNTASPISDVVDFYAWISGVKTKCFAIEANGNIYTCGNSQTYGTSPQGTPSFVRAYGGGLATGELSPPYLDLLDFAGNWRSTLATSTSVNGAVCVQSTAPGANCTPGTVLMPNAMSAAGDLIVGGTPIHELSAPAQPTQYSISTGSIPNGTTVNWVASYGNASSQETTASVSSGTTLANSGPYSITVDSSVPSGDASGWNLYACAGVSCTNYQKQNSSLIALGTNYTMNTVTTGGAAPPVSNATPVLYANPTRLALGASGNCLQSNGTTVVYGACGGTSSTFQVNGTNLTSSSTINWENGGPITVTNPSTGNVQFNCATCLVQNPTTTAQNTITGQNATSVPLTIQGFGNTGGDAFDIFNNGWHSLYVNAFGDLIGGKDIESNGDLQVDANATGAHLIFNTNSDMITFANGATGNGDIRGQLAVTSATSASFTFPLAYGSAPVCTLTPISNPGALTWWVTTTSAAVTANLSASGTITFNYICVGFPN